METPSTPNFLKLKSAATNGIVHVNPMQVAWVERSSEGGSVLGFAGTSLKVTTGIEETLAILRGQRTLDV